MNFTGHAAIFPRLLLTTTILAALACGCTSSIADRFLASQRSESRIEDLRILRGQVIAAWGHKFQEIQYSASDGTPLSACMLLPATNSSFPAVAMTRPRGVIVLLHGLSNQKEWMLREAEGFASNGYLAVCADLRGHGASGGRFTSFGYHERHDMARLMDILAADGFDTLHVGVVGRSLGAVTAIQWAAIDRRVKAVVAIAPFADLRAEANYLYAAQQPCPSQWKINMVEDAVEREGNFRIDDVTPIRCVRVMNTPIYFIHGDRDDIVPSSQCDALFENARGPTVIERVANTGHRDVSNMAGDALHQRIDQWLNSFVPADATAAPPDWASAMPHRNLVVSSAAVRAPPGSAVETGSPR